MQGAEQSGGVLSLATPAPLRSTSPGASSAGPSAANAANPILGSSRPSSSRPSQIHVDADIFRYFILTHFFSNSESVLLNALLDSRPGAETPAEGGAVVLLDFFKLYFRKTTLRMRLLLRSALCS